VTNFRCIFDDGQSSLNLDGDESLVFASSAILEAEHVGFKLVCGSPFPGTSPLASTRKTQSPDATHAAFEDPKETEYVYVTSEREDLDELEDLNETQQAEATYHGKQSELSSL
jgi:hypothetical protein